MRSRLGTAARLVRGSVLGVTWAFALLGVASAHDGGSWPTVARVLAAATAFHVAVYVWNDLVDLPLDRTEPRRATSPLVLGTVSPRAALTVSSGAAACALVLLTTLEAVLAMAAGLALLGAYDVWGKRCSFPPVTDAVQGLGWAALVWAGAAQAGGATVLTAWLGAAVLAQILLANGVVGAGRDVPNDQRHGARTTALLLGARAEGDRVLLTTGLRVYGVVLHVATVALVLGALAAGGGASPWRVAAVLGGGVLACVALVVALTAAGQARAWTAGLAHVLVMVLLPFGAVPRLDGPLAAALVVLAVAPWAGSGWVRDRLRAAVGRHVGRHVGRNGAVRGPLGRLRALSLLLRTGSVVGASALCLVGARLSGGGTGPRVALAVVLVAAAVAFAQVVNDLTDVEVDRLGKPHRPLAAGTISIPTARGIAAAAAAVALAAGALLGPPLLAAAAALVTLSWGYSRWWKGTVLAGNAVVALLTSTPVVIGAAAASGVDRRTLAAQLVVLVFMGGFELVKTGLDRDGDLAAGLRTVATVAGVRSTAVLGAACCVAFAVTAWVPAALSADARAYAAVMVPGAVAPVLAAAVLLVRGGRSPHDLRRPLTLLRVAWYAGIGSLVLL